MTSVPVGTRGAVVRTAALWLLLLAPFFYLTYGVANWLASLRADVPDLAFSWEKHIPFWAWTIIPYWSINAFYALSLFVNDTPQNVGRLARRYLTAQIVAVFCFIAFPLQAIFARPETHGLPGFMFDVLGGFDKPFNQAPSLHIALLVIIWDHWRNRLKGLLRGCWHVWCLLIGLSVLTTWQHHFIDIPTGVLLGLFALWLFPADKASPLSAFSLTQDRRAWRLALIYMAGAAAFFLIAAVSVRNTGAGLLWLWPSLALALVAVGYAGAGPQVFQKESDGTSSLASRWLLLPYCFGAKLNRWWWTRHLPAAVDIGGGVFLGRVPKRNELSAYAGVVDMTAEFLALRDPRVDWRAIPSLDLLTLSPASLREGALAIDDGRVRGPLLICCALGFQRSAAVAACWLVYSGRAPNAAAAAEQLQALGRPVHLKSTAYAAIDEAAR
ncbi:serine/threonine protein phosphatase [Agrobacterium tumefaciens]|uniref:phosphatase PAP2/dual specificity phosphatase family protein n=1 Tax=Agrobacterium tumefaciens TaxID=358 RepID=UPI00287D459D|nr:serine/threonine protein phosphatase [Agrobacterium tumefaciens]MDS7594340.1 serine/threonine protein phosphatase [Agrobacterium tumefaciens]